MHLKAKTQQNINEKGSQVKEFVILKWSVNSAYEISIPIAPPPMDPFSVTTADLPNSVFLSYNDSSTHSCKSRIRVFV